MNLNNQDYTQILNFYNLAIPKKRHLIKKRAEDILADKLCRCIKKVKIGDEKKSVGVCSRSIFNKKGITRGTFKCKKNKRNITMKKKKKKLTMKKKAKKVDNT